MALPFLPIDFFFRTETYGRTAHDLYEQGVVNG